MLQQSGVFDGFEIRLLRHDLPPVGQVEKSSGQVFGQTLKRHRHQQRREGHQQEHHDQGGRKQAACSAKVKSRKVDVAGLRVFLQHQRGDDEARHGEENVHPQKTSGQKVAQIQVVADDGQHGHAAQTIQARQTGQCAHGAVRPKSVMKRLASSR